MNPVQIPSPYQNTWFRNASSLLKTAFPLIIAQLAVMSMSLIDTLMAGRLGSEALASIGLGTAIFSYSLTIFSGLMLAVGPMVSHAQGGGKPQDAANAARHGMMLAVLVGIPMTLLFRNADPLLSLLGQPETTIAVTSQYLRAVSFGFIPYLCYLALRGLMEGSLHTRPVMLFSFIAVGMKVLLNYMLMFGGFGFPNLGLQGAGLSTMLVECLLFGLGVWYVGSRFRAYRVFSFDKPQRDVLRELLRIGVPIGLSLAFESGLFTVTTILMGTLGELELAAHQIASQSVYFTFMIPLGIASATAVHVGQAYGKGDILRVKQMGRLGVFFAITVMLLFALMYWFLPRFVIGLYIDVDNANNTGIVQLATLFLSIAAMFQVFDGTQVANAAALRGLKDTRIPMVISVISYWLIGLGSAVLFAFVFDLGGRGLWFGLVLGLAVAAVLLTLRFNITILRRLERST
ncbi:MAG: MATE family efflux transporter [Trueperaceae bacterium]